MLGGLKAVSRTACMLPVLRAQESRTRLPTPDQTACSTDRFTRFFPSASSIKLRSTQPQGLLISGLPPACTHRFSCCSAAF